MPKFIINYAFDCSCYGNRTIDADSAEDAVVKAKQMHAEDTLIQCWDPQPDVGTTNHRVVAIYDADADGECVDDGFSLDETAAE